MSWGVIEDIMNNMLKDIGEAFGDEIDVVMEL